MNQKYKNHEIRSRPRKSRINRDYNTNEVWMSIIFLSVFGLLMVFSASSIQCISYEMYGNDPMFFLKRQLAFTIAGIIVCFISQYINYSVFYRLAKIMYLISIFTILLLKTPLGITANGATRWLNIGGIQFQVAEIVKISVIIMLSYMVQHYAKHVDTLALTIRLWCTGGFVAFLLVIISNDLSSSLVILGITFGITFIYTRKEKLHFFIIGFSIIIIGFIIWKLKLNLPTSDELGNMSFRVGRIAAWIDPEKYSSTQGYQTMQSLYAIGSGGLFGKGLGNSSQKISAIPEAQNDMIFSIICEEFGVFGATALIVLYLYLFYHLVMIAYKSRNIFGLVLVTGVLLHIALQTFMNIGVNVNLLPNTGIGLPFISYGGTAIFCQLFEIGMVLSVSRQTQGFKTFDLYCFLKKLR